MKLKILIGIMAIIGFALSTQTSSAFPGGGPSQTTKMCLYDHTNAETGDTHRYKQQLIFAGNCPVVNPPEDDDGTKHLLSAQVNIKYLPGLKIYEKVDTHECQVEITEVLNP